MDPEVTVLLIMEYLSDSEYEEAFYSCLDLQGWLKKGGTGIDGVNSVDLDVWCQVTKKLCKKIQWEKEEC